MQQHSKAHPRPVERSEQRRGRKRDQHESHRYHHAPDAHTAAPYKGKHADHQERTHEHEPEGPVRRQPDGLVAVE